MEDKLELQPWMTEKRLIVVVGHYGSGKTEFSVNLALTLAAAGRKTMLADLDIVNPYFRSRERKQLLQEHGIRLIASSQACTDADVPALPAELLTLLQDDRYCGVLDLGGNETGARVMARFRPQLAGRSVQVLFIYNANRPLVAAPERAAACLLGIEQMLGVRVTGIVNNTHLCELTDEHEVHKGAAPARQLARLTDLPLLCHAVPHELAPRLTELREPIFPMKLYMTKPWDISSSV